MSTRNNIFACLIAMGLCGFPLVADEAKDAPAPGSPKAPAKEDGPREGGNKDSKDNDDRPSRGDRGPDRGPGGPGPGAEWGQRPPSMNGSRFELFSTDELKLMIEAVEPKNKRLADKMKERFAEVMAKKPTQLTQQQIDALLDVFHDRDPRLAKRLREGLEANPERVTPMLVHQWPRLEKTIELKASDRQLYDAQTAEILKQNEGRDLVFALRKATQADPKDAAEITRLQAELKTKLLEQHKSRQAIRRLELDRMNDRIAKLSEEITAEESRASDLIDKHLANIIKWSESDWGRGKRGDGKDGKDKSDRGEKRE